MTTLTPTALAALAPGEWLVRCLRDGWTVPPDRFAIARANAAIQSFGTRTGAYRGGEPNQDQRECLEGQP